MIDNAGVLCLGLVIGWLLYYSIRHFKESNWDANQFATLSGAVVSAAIIKFTGENKLGWYGIGLAGGFFSYLVVTLLLLFLAPASLKKAEKVNVLMKKAFPLALTSLENSSGGGNSPAQADEIPH
jgi:NhaP-type Na+/H+ or K+/H+ antiporter